MSKAPAVDYALQIIELFTRGNDELGIADISNSLAINKNAVSRILEALLEKKLDLYEQQFSKKVLPNTSAIFVNMRTYMQ